MRFNHTSTGRWKWLLFAIFPVAALIVAGTTMNTSPPTNVAQTTPEAAPELRTRFYSQPVDQVLLAAQTIAGEQKTWFRSWRVTKIDDNAVYVEVPVLVFTDDLTIHVDTHNRKTRVNVRSHSRVGRGDFGENHRHVAQFLRALDEKLAN